ncbi:MAG: DUF427 domain-containing protein [Gammaproteobacteria bacterium]|jgi:uncharacterized protein (DUF427 family)|nr:DUF427 domain-containing protein [Gammaproteobacteria bacterium]MBT4493430.1 DUF427 domain-containing protein [Gammaproteobacteria bacterium]MBT5875606.1 DUF427 domain-containing protein [Candidatus Latescibacterota bacterium]MBT7369245.1 DUF427 domain-containing protein [Gammaproteobacteria bacterium]
MSQFPMTDSRRSILERIPDYEVRVTATDSLINVRYGDLLIADTTSALLIHETRHGDVYYLPPKDIDWSLLEPTELSTYCPFKGHASYWSLKGEDTLENFVWSYRNPYPEVEELKDYMSFYTDRVEVKAG